MRELDLTQMSEVSAGKHISFFCSYALADKGYDAYSAIGISSMMGLTCALPVLSTRNPSEVTGLAFISIVNSFSGYFLSNLVNKS